MATKKGVEKAKDLADQVEADVDADRPVDAEVDAPAPTPDEQEIGTDLATGDHSRRP